MEERKGQSGLDINPLIGILGNEDPQKQILSKELIKDSLAKVETAISKLTYIEEAYNKIIKEQQGVLTDSQMQNIWNLKLAYLEAVLDEINDLENKYNKPIMLKDQLRIFNRKLIGVQPKDSTSLLDFSMGDWLPNNKLMINSREVFKGLITGSKDARENFTSILKKEDIAPAPVRGSLASADLTSPDTNPLIGILGNEDPKKQILSKELIKGSLAKVEPTISKLTYIEEAYNKIIKEQQGVLTDSQMQNIWNLKLAYLEAVLDEINDLENKYNKPIVLKDQLRIFNRKVIGVQPKDSTSLLDFNMGDWLPNNKLMINSKEVFKGLITGSKDARENFSSILKKEDIAPAPVWGSLASADLMIFCYSITKHDDNSASNELLDLLQNGNSEKLAHWLDLHSFIEWRLRQVISKEGYLGGEVSEGLVAGVHAIIQEYSKEVMLKRTVPKFTIDDVGKDYIEAYNNLASSLYEKEKPSQSSLSMQSLSLLVNAKNRRSQALGRHFHGECVGNPYDPSSFDQLVSKMTSLKTGERRQFFFMYGKPHAMSFDVERDANGKLRIYCFESGSDPSMLKVVDRLTQVLKEGEVDCEIKACMSQLQVDNMNCSIYSLVVMSELAKYPHVFDYLPPVLSQPYLSNIAEIKGGHTYTLGDYFTFADSIEMVQWVNVEDMPTKVIATSQSYGAMKDRLEWAADFDHDVDEFIKEHKKRYEYVEDEKPKSTSKEERDLALAKKYIGRKRMHIGERLNQEKENLLQAQLERTLDRYPLIANITQSNFIELFKQNDVKQHPDVNLALKQLDEIFKTVSLMYSNQKPDIELSQNLLFLREQYLELLLKQSNASEIINAIKKTGLGSILSNRSPLIDLNREQLKESNKLDRFESLVQQLYDKLGPNHGLSERRLNGTCVGDIFMQNMAKEKERDKQDQVPAPINSSSLSVHINNLIDREIVRLQEQSPLHSISLCTPKIKKLRNLQQKIALPENQHLSVAEIIGKLQSENNTVALGFLKKIQSDYADRKLGDAVQANKFENEVVRKSL